MPHSHTEQKDDMFSDKHGLNLWGQRSNHPLRSGCFCSLALLLSSAPFLAKCEWLQAASPSVGTLRARLSPSLPGCSLSPRPRTLAAGLRLASHPAQMQTGSQHRCEVLWAPLALWYYHRQHVWVWLAYGCGVIPDPTAGTGGDRCTERRHWFKAFST